MISVIKVIINYDNVYFLSYILKEVVQPRSGPGHYTYRLPERWGMVVFVMEVKLRTICEYTH